MATRTTVLIVDDHPLFRNGLRQVIADDPRFEDRAAPALPETFEDFHFAKSLAFKTHTSARLLGLRTTWRVYLGFTAKCPVVDFQRSLATFQAAGLFIGAQG